MTTFPSSVSMLPSPSSCHSVTVPPCSALRWLPIGGPHNSESSSSEPGCPHPQSLMRCLSVTVRAKSTMTNVVDTFNCAVNYQDAQVIYCITCKKTQCIRSLSDLQSAKIRIKNQGLLQCAPKYIFMIVLSCCLQLK